MAGSRYVPFIMGSLGWYMRMIGWKPPVCGVGSLINHDLLNLVFDLL